MKVVIIADITPVSVSRSRKAAHSVLAGLVQACPGHPRGAVSGRPEAYRQLDDVDDRDKPGHDGSAVAIPAPMHPSLLLRTAAEGSALIEKD